MPNEKSLANLRPPWKPGESGNPKGRPKRRTLEEEVNALLEKPLDESGTTRLDQMAERIVEHIVGGKDTSLTREMLKRIWPEVRRHEVSADVELSGEMEIAASELSRFLGELD